MKCFITGAAGFVGSNMSEKLLESGEEIIAADSLVRRGSEKNLEMLMKKHPNLKFRQSEIEDIPSLINKERPDLIYHFAAQVAVTSSVDNPIRDFKINAEGSLRIAKSAYDLGIPVIYTSTNKVYGDNVNKIPLKELEKRYDFDGEFERKGLPEDFSVDATHHTPYGVSKLVGDLYVREFGGISNRCSCMYGKYQHGIIDQGWVSYFASRKIKGEPITIFGDGKQVRDLLHINDVVRLLVLQGKIILKGDLDIRGEVFNVGGGYENTISLLELCERWDIHPTFSDWRPSDQKVFYVDPSKSKRVLGWVPEVSLEEGLRDIYEVTKRNL